MTQNGRRNETRAHSVSLPPFEFPRRIDRSDRIEPIDRSIRSDPIREISALRYRHEARQPRLVIAIAIAVPDCDSFYREPIDRIANIDRIARSLPRVFPTFIRAPTISQLRVSSATIHIDVEGKRKGRKIDDHRFLLLDLVP